MNFHLVKTVLAATTVSETCIPIKLGPITIKTECAAPLTELETVFGNVIELLLGFGAIALFAMLLVGGFKWITAGGDPKGIEGARNTVTAAIGGLILLAISYLILVLIHEFTGAEVLNFKIFQP